MNMILKSILIIITNRQYNLLDVALFCTVTTLIVYTQFAIAFCITIVGSILNALVSLKVSKL